MIPGSGMTLGDRAAAYARRFPEWPAPRTDARWLDGMWVLGNDYRNKSPLYGAFPPGLLLRVFALFPDASAILHVFSGSLTDAQVTEAWISANVKLPEGMPQPALPRQYRLDNAVMPEAAAAGPDIIADAEDVAQFPGPYDLVIADPPYEDSDAAKYKAKPVNKAKVLKEIAKVVPAGGVLVWLDTSLPMFSKEQWHWWGAIGVVRSTNHRVRLLSMFRREG